MKFRNQYDNKPIRQGSVNTGKSMTVPDQTISLKKLLENHTRGIPSPVKMLEGQYFDTEIPHVDDLTDLAALRARLEELELQLKEQVNDYDQKKRQAAAQSSAGTVQGSESTNKSV